MKKYNTFQELIDNTPFETIRISGYPKYISGKCNEIIEISDKIVSLDDYIIFNDNWIDENDTILSDKNGNLFYVLDFQVIERNECVHPEIMPYFNGWRLEKRNCFKLDKKTKIGDVLFIVK